MSSARTSEVFDLKKAIILAGSIGIALALAGGGLIVWIDAVIMRSHKEIGIADKTDNINVMLTRPAQWRKLAEHPALPKYEMDMIDGSTATIPITAELFRQFYDMTDHSVNENRIVLHSTTHSAYLMLINREHRIHDIGRSTDLILVTPPSEEEKQYAADKNVELDLTAIALDGFVFITHKDNPVSSLTVEQIQDIYTGKITNWKQVGGEDLDIQAYQREPNSGSQTAMEQLVMQGKPMSPPAEILQAAGMGMLIEAVAEYANGPTALGYTYAYYMNNLYKNEHIKIIPIDGIAPTHDNLRGGTYPFTTQYYAVIRGDEPEDSPARTLRDYLVTPEGQSLIEMAGYCRAVD